MKTLILGALAASIAATPVAAAPYNGFDGHGRSGWSQQDRRHDNYRDYPSYRNQDHRWGRGQRFDRRYARNYRVINNPRAYHLHDAPRGYHWVQSGDDVVLVAIASGIIGAVLANILD